MRGPRGLLVRAVLVLLCSVGLVGMHQFAAAAQPMAAQHSHHHCVDASEPSATSTDCHTMDHACAAVLTGSWTVPSDGSALTGALPPAPIGPARPDVRASGADPPDLRALSVSRT